MCIRQRQALFFTFHIDPPLLTAYCSVCMLFEIELLRYDCIYVSMSKGIKENETIKTSHLYRNWLTANNDSKRSELGVFVIGFIKR